MKITDLDVIIKIENSVFPNPWPKYFFEADIASEQAVKVTALDGDIVIGYGLATVAGPELHITNVAVDHSYHRQGIGTRLVHWLEDKGIKSGCEEVYLEVRVSNRVAQRLYESLGYVIAYTRRYYYLDGEDAYIMKRKLQEKPD